LQNGMIQMGAVKAVTKADLMKAQRNDWKTQR
jgi:hypothetical protein